MFFAECAISAAIIIAVHGKKRKEVENFANFLSFFFCVYKKSITFVAK